MWPNRKKTYLIWQQQGSFFITELVIRGTFGKKHFHYSDANFFRDINNKFSEKKYLAIGFFTHETHRVITRKVLQRTGPCVKPCTSLLQRIFRVSRFPAPRTMCSLRVIPVKGITWPRNSQSNPNYRCFSSCYW